MRVSWLIPVHNGRLWLGDAVRSALADCEAGDQVVVVDDGSTDGCLAALPDDPRLSTLRQPRRGLVAALETGRRRCRGELIARLDADDRAIPGRLAAQRRLLAGRPEVAAVGGRAVIFRDGGEVPEGMHRYVAWVNGLSDPHPELLVESPLFHPATTFRAAAVEEIGGYREGDFPEDYDLWLRLVAAGHRLANLAQPVVAIRDRDDRLTRNEPRYRHAAFDRCRRAFLAATALSEPRRVVLWCGRAAGRPWLRWLRRSGHQIPAVVDVATGRQRGGAPVVPPSALPGLELDLLLVAVGSRGARQEIRAAIAALRPDLEEGRTWWALR